MRTLAGHVCQAARAPLGAVVPDEVRLDLKKEHVSRSAAAAKGLAVEARASLQELRWTNGERIEGTS